MVQTNRTLSRIEIDERVREARLAFERSTRDAEAEASSALSSPIAAAPLLRTLRLFMLSGDQAPVSRPGRRWY
jgi:hypothetical protein